MFKLSQLLLSPKKAKRHPFEIVFVGFFYASISLFLSLWIFPEYASLVMVFLSVISTLYITQAVLIVEEKNEKNTIEETKILKGHAKTLWFFLLLFLGFLFAFTFWTIVLPENTVSLVFNLQESAVLDIRSITGNATLSGNFLTILSNNLRVFLLSLLFALFYGAGAIFILAWNGSIMGFVIGSLVKNSLGLAGLPLAFLKYFLHGIPEMLAYFAAALAGGILFVSFIRGDFKKGRIKRTMTDTLIVVILALFLLIIAALIEAYISPFI